MAKINKIPTPIKKQSLSDKVDDALCYQPTETMTEADAAEVLMDCALRLIGKAEFELWRCDEGEGCESCKQNKKASLRLKEDCQILMALTARNNRGAFPALIQVSTLDNLIEAMNDLAAKVFPQFNPLRRDVEVI